MAVLTCRVLLLLLLYLLLESYNAERFCSKIGDFNLPVLKAEGDILIGGLFPLHYMESKPDHNYTSKPGRRQCSGFDLRAFRWAQTMVFAIEEINRKATLLPGVTLGYRIMDSCDNVHTGLTGGLSLASGTLAPHQNGGNTEDSQCTGGDTAPVSAVIGLASSTPTRALAHTLGPFGIPVVSYFATCTCLTDKRVYPSFLRTVPSDMFQVQGLVQLVGHFGWHWVGTLGTEDDYSRYGIQAFSEQLREWGGCLAFHQTIPKAATAAKIGAIADVLEATTARVVIAFATEGQLLDLLTEVARRNLTRLQWVASEAWVTASLLTLPEFQPVLAGTLGFSFRGTAIPGLSDFLLKVRPSPGPQSAFANMFWEELFGCKLAFGGSHSSSSAFNTETPQCSGDEDLTARKTSYSDVSQVRISYNVYKAVYAIAHALHDMLQCGALWGNASRLGCKRDTEFTPRQLLTHLKTVNFINQFGEEVSFDSNGEPVPLYDIINWQRDQQGDMVFQKVGSYDGSAAHGKRLWIDEDAIVWTGGNDQAPVSVCSQACPPGSRKAARPGEAVCCFDCLPCAEGQISNTTGATECMPCPLYYWSDRDRVACVAGVEEFLSFQETLGIILVALSLLGVSTAAVVTVIFLCHKTTPIVRANNSEISFLLLLSLKLCFLCSLVFMGRPSPWSCRARQAAFGISFVLSISCILVKTIVVLLAFRSALPGSRAVQLFGPAQQRVFIFCCAAVQVVLCAGWLAVSPPEPTKNTSYKGGRILLECKGAWPQGFYLVLGYVGLLSCVCFVLAFMGRKLPDTFNEAKLITFSMLIFFAVWISFIPAHNSSPGKYTVAVEVFAILASSFGLLFCIFAPKCYIILFKPEQNTKKGMTRK